MFTRVFMRDHVNDEQRIFRPQRFMGAHKIVEKNVNRVYDFRWKIPKLFQTEHNFYGIVSHLKEIKAAQANKNIR